MGLALPSEAVLDVGVFLFDMSVFSA